MTAPHDEALPPATASEPGPPPAADKRSRWRLDRRALCILLGAAVLVPGAILLVAYTTDPEPPRPQYSKFASGTFTSGWGAEWGVQHMGVDIAGPVGTPIVAVADGTVLEAGTAAGFGMWVRLLHDDGTITIYGHIDTATVSNGQRVLSGDQIATVGNRGFSTRPHCHFEVWLHGKDKVDPLPWLVERGIDLGPMAP